MCLLNFFKPQPSLSLAWGFTVSFGEFKVFWFDMYRSDHAMTGKIKSLSLGLD